MAGQPGVPPAPTVTALDPDPDPVAETAWLARSDRIWNRVMPHYHELDEAHLWDVLTWSAKCDE
jgi:hypothetical protein